MNPEEAPISDFDSLTPQDQDLVRQAVVTGACDTPVARQRYIDQLLGLSRRAVRDQLPTSEEAR